MKMTRDELNKIIAKHSKWILGEKDGKPANLSGVDISGEDLRWEDLRWIDLRLANLSESKLKQADLRETKLRNVCLKGADLRETNLSNVDLRGVDLRETNLKGAVLRGADLRETNLKGADLRGADLNGVTLAKDMYQIIGCGSVKRTTTYDALNNQVICGCWVCDEGNTLENFEKRIVDVYGENGESPNIKYYQEYMGAINFFTAMKKLED